MLEKLTSNASTFKSLKFKPGFNLIVSERTTYSSSKDSRNGTGKTTFIEILHFLFGSERSRNITLNKKELDDWIFELDFEIDRKQFKLSKSTLPRTRYQLSGDIDYLKEIPKRVDNLTNTAEYSVDEMKYCLAGLFFNLDRATIDSKYSPTFRSLISYFIRRGGEIGGFLDPFKHCTKQAEWDSQVNTCYLIGIEWKYASQFQMLSEKTNNLKKLRDAVKTNLFSNLMGTIGEWEAEKVKMIDQIEKTREDLNNFKVHEQYSEIENETNKLTQEIHELSNMNISDKKMIELYQEAIATEKPAKKEELEDLYNEAGVVFPSIVSKRLSDVVSFHEQIILNRLEFLNNEVDLLTVAISKRTNEIKQKDEKRAELMNILATHKALEEYTKLQERHQQSVAKLNEIETRLENLKKMEKETSNLKVEKEMLKQKTRAEHDENKSHIKAISIFNENSQKLYDSPAKLAINVTDKGYDFKINVERAGSTGIGKMKVFCYDLMLAQMWSELSDSVFLVHDSEIFDGVDERQVAQSIKLAIEKSTKYGFQYILLINSDQIPKNDLSKLNIDYSQYVIAELTDATEEFQFS